MKNITRFMVKYWHWYLFGLSFMVLSIALDMFTPRITQAVIDDVLLGGEFSKFKMLGIGIIMIAFGKAISSYIKEFTFDLVSTKIVFNMRKNLFDHIQGLSYRFFSKNNTGELMARIKDDIDNVWFAVGFGAMLVVEAIIVSVTALVIMFIKSPLLSIIAIVAMPLIGFFALQLEKHIGKVYEDMSDQNSKLNTVAQENISGVRVVKAFAREKHEAEKFLKDSQEYRDLNIKQTHLFAKYYPNIQFITRLLPVVIVVAGGIIVINGGLTLGELVAFTGYMGMIVWPMELIGWLSNAMAQAFASQKKIDELLLEKTEIIESACPLSLENAKGEISFKNVSLSLDETKILEDISFTVKPGKTLGVMGATGAGKSSLINLLIRFYDPTDGEILLDGHSIKEYSLRELRKNISLVMQDVFLFSDTIEENIKLGKKDMSRQELSEAAESARAKDFIDRMDKGFDTIIGERGIGLSGGQKQRISIARALGKEAPIIVFDDSTSALDMETEHMIQKTLNSLHGVTKIIIGHRISAVKDADEIIILEDSKIVERGKHEDLLAKKGYYYDTFNAQYENYME